MRQRYAQFCAGTEVRADTGLRFCSAQEVVCLSYPAVMGHKTMCVMGKHACANVGQSNESVHLCLNLKLTALVVFQL